MRGVNPCTAAVWVLLTAALALPNLAWADDPPPVRPHDLSSDGDTYLRPTVSLEAAIFSESNAYIGNSREVIGDHVGYWWEWVVTGGLDGALSLGGAGLLFGRASAIGAGSQGLDAAGSNFDNHYPEKLEMEDLYVGWRSGELLSKPRQGRARDLGRQAALPDRQRLLHVERLDRTAATAAPTGSARARRST